jgi:hypothetical protein
MDMKVAATGFEPVTKGSRDVGLLLDDLADFFKPVSLGHP